MADTIHLDSISHAINSLLACLWLCSDRWLYDASPAVAFRRIGHFWNFPNRNFHFDFVDRSIARPVIMIRYLLRLLVTCHICHVTRIAHYAVFYVVFTVTKCCKFLMSIENGVWLKQIVIRFRRNGVRESSCRLVVGLIGVVNNSDSSRLTGAHFNGIFKQKKSSRVFENHFISVLNNWKNNTWQAIWVANERFPPRPQANTPPLRCRQKNDRNVYLPIAWWPWIIMFVFGNSNAAAVDLRQVREDTRWVFTHIELEIKLSIYPICLSNLEPTPRLSDKYCIAGRQLESKQMGWRMEME